MVPEAIEAVEAKWDSNPSFKRLVSIFLGVLKFSLPENSNTKLVLLK